MQSAAGSGKRVEHIVRALETALLDGRYPAGVRLPPERMLAAQYGVARNTVREALQRLAARNLLRIRPGAGVFVTDQLRTGTTSVWGQLVADHPALRDDIAEFRRVLEGATAYYAALRADAAELRELQTLLAALEAAHQRGQADVEAEADTRLHEAIARASHNAMFLHLHTSVIGMLREHIRSAGTNIRQHDAAYARLLLTQHRTVVEAIVARQPEEARTAMQTHIDFARKLIQQLVQPE
jgi:GntR family transcriptional repressor for pyruvate dehydrogenase complex